jgi:hypothetical protein
MIHGNYPGITMRAPRPRRVRVDHYDLPTRALQRAGTRHANDAGSDYRNGRGNGHARFI